MLFEGTQLPVFCHSSNRGLIHSYPHPEINTGVFLGERQGQEAFTETPSGRLAIQSSHGCARRHPVPVWSYLGWGGPGVQAWLKHLLRPDPVLSPAGRVSHGPTVIL